MLKWLLRHRTQGAVTEGLKLPLNKLAFAGATGRLPKGFWEDDYVLGYLYCTAMLLAKAATEGALSAQDYGLIVTNALDALAREYSNTPPMAVPNRLVALIKAPSAAYSHGIRNASKVVAFVYGWPEAINDPDVMGARDYAQRNIALFASIAGESSPEAHVFEILEEQLFRKIVWERLGR